MTRIAEIAAAAGLEPIDVALADLVGRMSESAGAVTPAASAALARTAALVSRELRNGHPCVELERWAGRSLTEGDDAASLPALAAWKRALAASPLVGTGETPTPLVLDSAGRCYLHRYWAAERRVAERVRAAAPLDAIESERVTAAFARLFPAPKDGATDRQADAARAVLRSRLTLLTGGPGTGKTTTVARILALLLADDDSLEIVLAAPTGKAATRLSESLREQAPTLDVAAALREKIGAFEARTIHRVLGYSGRTGTFRHNAERPLPCAVLIVDEASMVDLLLMDALLAAVPSHARVVLVGDKDQLASVDAGFVFGDLSEVAATSVLKDSAVELDVSWRFHAQPGIAALAAAVRTGDVEGAAAALDGSHADARLAPLAQDPTTMLAALVDQVDAVVTATTAAEALAALTRFRILSPTRRGPHGVESLNRLIERGLAERGHLRAGEWYTGRPVLVTQNDYDVDLYNGDVGVAFPDQDGTIRVWFAGASGLRSVATGKLPPHETAWAMTVHKCQGSEFDCVVFVLPEKESPLLTRELVYTAVTRARSKVTIYGALATLTAAVERKSERVSGLRDLLAGP